MKAATATAAQAGAARPATDALAAAGALEPAPGAVLSRVNRSSSGGSGGSGTSSGGRSSTATTSSSVDAASQGVVATPANGRQHQQQKERGGSSGSRDRSAAGASSGASGAAHSRSPAAAKQSQKQSGAAPAGKAVKGSPHEGASGLQAGQQKVKQQQAQLLLIATIKLLPEPRDVSERRKMQAEWQHQLFCKALKVRAGTAAAVCRRQAFVLDSAVASRPGSCAEAAAARAGAGPDLGGAQAQQVIHSWHDAAAVMGLGVECSACLRVCWWWLRLLCAVTRWLKAYPGSLCGMGQL